MIMQASKDRRKLKITMDFTEREGATVVGFYHDLAKHIGEVAARHGIEVEFDFDVQPVLELNPEPEVVEADYATTGQ